MTGPESTSTSASEPAGDPESSSTATRRRSRGPDAVSVHVNRKQPETLTADDTALETSDSFVLQLYGHDAPAHVHCRLDDDLARVAALETPNYYIEADTVTPVPISVTADSLQQPVRGELEVLTGYGSESISIAITIAPGPPEIDVDESLSTPARTDDDQQPSFADELQAALGLDLGTLAVITLGLLALVIAMATAASLGGTVATVGVGVVVAGVVAALFLLVWSPE